MMAGTWVMSAVGSERTRPRMRSVSRSAARWRGMNTPAQTIAASITPSAAMRTACRINRGLTPPARRIGVARCDQPHLAVENAHEHVKIPWAVSIPRCGQQFAVRAHVALDVGAGIGQQRFEYRPGRALM